MAAAVGEQAVLVEQAAVQRVRVLPPAVARGKHWVALVHRVTDAVNSGQGRRERDGRSSSPSRAVVLPTGSSAAGRPLCVWEERAARRIFAKKTVHIIRTHIFFFFFFRSDLLAQNPQCRFYEVV